MTSEKRVIEMNISESNVRAQIETFLRNIGSIHDNEDLMELELGGVKLGAGTFPMVLTISTGKEVMKNTE